MGMAAAEAQFHVLAVDDSLIDRKLIERLLKTSSYQVTTVDSGSKALEVLGWNDDRRCNSNDAQVVEVNLVITDYCMPGMTGYDLLKKMKESSFLKNIPVVIMSSENVPSRINRCLQEGAEEFFLKPVRLSDVNKLRPHIVKQAKSNPDEEKMYSCKGHFDEKPEKEEGKKEKGKAKEKEKEKEETQQPQLKLQLQPQASQSNKRKPIDEGLSPDRTRARYSDLTVLSS